MMVKIKEMILEKINKSNLEIQVVFKEDDDGKLTQNNQISIEPTAQYEPSTKTINISLKKVNEMLSTIKKDEKAAYVDSLIAHELGHATDCSVEKNLNDLKNHKARWKQALVKLTGQDQNDDVSAILSELLDTYRIMKSINLELETNAWLLGRNFSEYPEIFEKFNEDNIATYQKIYRIYSDMLERISTGTV